MRILFRLPLRSSVLLFALAFTPGAGTGQTPIERVRSLELDSLREGPATSYFAPGDSARAEELAGRATAAAGFYERELGLAARFYLAVLSPGSWFSPYGGENEPYGMPWGWNADTLIAVPSSLTEGVLIQGRGDRPMVDFVALHELGHLTAKQYFHPESGHDFGVPIRWFEEFLASYFAISAAHAADPDWIATVEQRSTMTIGSFDPAVRSFDWAFMKRLPGADFARTYAWYQSMLNLAAIEIHGRLGVGLLRSLKENLNWAEVGEWTSDEILLHLRELAPEFETWERRLSEHPGP